MRKFYLLFLALNFILSGLQSQINRFCFNAASGTYTQLSGGTAVSILADDANVQNIPFGFSFNYLGTSYAQASVSSNGWLSFSNSNPTAANSRTNNIATTTAGLVNTLYPLWDDLNGTGGTASYLTAGAAGSRIFTMEWRNWKWDYLATGSTISYQIKLYEGTNVIEFVYRPETGAVRNGSTGASIGLTDAIGGSTHYLSLNNSGANPAVSSTVPTNGIATKPALGQIYRFTPSAVPTITGINPNPVCSTGTTVTIIGTNFNSCLSAVSFNGTAAATFAYVNATTITAVVPAGATSGPVSITTLGGTATSATALTISANGSIVLSSGNASPAVCINNAIPAISYTIGGTATGAVLSGSMPAGVTGSFSAGIFSISGTATASGTFPYTITTTGSSCTNPSLSGTITINNDATISLLSSAGTDAQTLCINTSLANISYAIGAGGTGATVSGLPPGVTGSYAAGIFTISGNPAAPGSFNYTVTTTGPCIKPSLTGTITVTGNGSILLSSAAGTNTQSTCFGNSITDISYNIGGTSTGASITAGSLPPGVSGSFNAGVFTITGTPAASGIFSYTVGASGSSCINPVASGTITVNEDAIISLSSPAGTDAQALCALTAITDITYNTGGFGTTGVTVSGLPSGVTGSFAAGIFTISGSPTTTGTFNYTVTTTGPCINASLSGSIIVNSNGTVTLSSGAGTDAQALCLNNALTDITYTVDPGATGASITAGSLPAGVTGSFASGVFTISGTPTVPGSFNYTVGASGSPCANFSAGGTITVNENATISLSSVAGTDAQTRCVNTPITNITYAIGGFGTTGATVIGLPAGISGIYNSGVFTISGTATVSGTFNYIVTTTGPCVNSVATGSITVQANSTITLSSGTASQTKCINTVLTTVTYTIGGGATGAILSAGSFPAGVTGSFAGAAFTISGTPTVAGVFPYSVTTTGPCINPTVSGTLTINGDATISLSSAAGTDAQTKCINTAITNITYAVGGFGTTGATVTGLPAGVNGSYVAGVFTISGTPTVSGIFNYTVSTTGPCIKPTAGGSITVQANATITRTSAASTTAQTVCINNPITNITYAIAGSGSGATVTGLPAGINGVFSAGVFTISGAPTVSGTFNYTVTATGPCVNPSLGGTITVNADATITLSSAPATTSQTKCINTPITNITYIIGGGGTGATVAGLPAGVTGSYNSGTKVYTITGSPTAAGTFNYVVTTTGPCIKPTSGGTITVTPNATISLSSAAGTNVQTVCTNSPITNISYGIGGSGSGATVTGLPAGINENYSAGVYTISGSPTVAGTFNYVITTTGPCVNPSLSGTITVNAIPTGTLTATETSVTANDNIICAGSNVRFTATAGYGSYIFKVNGVTVQSGVSNIFNTTTLTNGASVTVNVANGMNCGATFGPVVITVNPLPTPTLTADRTSICPGDNVIFTAGGGTSYTFKVNGSSVQSGASNTYSSTTLANGNSVTVEVTNNNGCKATSSPVIITVNTLPSGTLSATGTSICTGDNVTFTATSGFSNYNFKVNGISIQNSSSNIFSSTALTNPSVVAVDVTNAASCMATFGPVVVTVNALPAGTLTSSENSGTANDNSICSGAVVTFIATSGFTNYDFRVNGISVQNSATNTYNNSSLADNDVVTVIVRSGSNCSATFNAITITVLASPSGILSASPLSICLGDNVDFTATAGFAGYNFKVNGSTVQNGAGNTYSSTSLTNGDVVSVDVTNNNTCTTTFNSITITVSPAPTGTLAISENSGSTADDGIICTGDNVLFTAPPGFTNYNFLLNGISIQNSPTNTYNSTSLVTGDQITVAVTNSGGCIGLLNTWTLTVNDFPVVQPVTGGLVICVNDATTLSNGTAGGNWSSTNTAIATIDAAGVVTGVSAGTVTIQYTVTNINGCSTVVTASVTVNALPVVAPVTGTTAICVNNTTQLSSTTPGGVWSSDNTTVASVNNASLVTGVSGGTANISYTVTNGNGCTKIVTAVITVNTLPLLTAITGTLSVCQGNTTQLSNNTTGGVWSSSNTSIATVNSSTGLVTGISAGPVTIGYIITDGNSCSSTVTADVIVSALPVPTLAGPNPICPNSTGVYTTEPGQFNYAWTFTGGTLVSGGTSTDNTITILWDQPGPKTIFVNYINANGCSGVTSATVTTSTGTVPTLAGPTSICLNADGNYSTNSGQSDYTWTVAGGNITAGGTLNDNTATINWNTAGTGSISINFTDVNGCTGATPVILPVTVYALPTAVISGTASVCLNSSATSVTFTGAAGAIPYTFTYNINGGTNQTISTTSGNSVTLPVPTGTSGIFTYDLVSISDNNNCFRPQTGTATITINELPTATVSGSYSVCQNSTSPVIIFTGTAGTAPFTFSYNINAGATQSVTTIAGNSVTVNVPTGSAGTFTYNLLNVSDINSCSQIQNGAATVIINPSPSGTVSGTTSVCQNSSSPNISFTGNGGTAPYVFTYNINGGGNLTVASIGNTANLAVPTAAAGIYTYNLVSVQDASISLCSGTITAAATVTVNPFTAGGAVNSNATVCSGTNSGTLTLTGHTGSVTRWEVSTDGGTTWIPVANITTSLAYSNLTTTTHYRAVVQSGVCAGANSAAAIITVNAVSVGGAVSANASVCSGTNSGTLTLSGHTGSVVRWEFSINGGASWTAIANTTTSQAYTNLTQTRLYRAVVSNGVCSPVNSSAVTITVNPLPTATVSGNVSVCLNAPSPNITFTGANGTAPYTFTYRINAGANVTVVSVGNTATVVAPTGIAGTFTYTLISVKDASATLCTQNQSGTATVTVNALPGSFIITPASVSMCQGSVQPLTASVNISSTGSKTVSSGAINLAIPDAGIFGNPGSVTSTLAITGIPAGAVITSVTANFNITHGYDDDLVLNLKAPNGNTINLVNERGGNGNNFTNTTISSIGILPVNSGTAPFTNTYSADLANNVGAPNASNAVAFSSLYGTPNGNWVFNAADVVWCHGFLCLGGPESGTLNSWTITINYNIPNSPLNVVWSPATNLYTDPAAIIPYAGQVLPTVYVKPASAGNIIYTATTTNVAGCSSSQTVGVTASPIPVVTITADYCTVPNKVRLTATSVPAATSYIWSTGATTQFIDVDIAGSFEVTAFAGGGCPGTATINVATELVANGDFESGNTGFITPPLGPNQYQYVADGAATNELNPEGLYGIGPDAHTYHTGFWGHDHTTGTGNFMIVNGFPNGNPQPIVWQETVNVLPNTTYYFSAWAMSVNSSGPFAQLQFNVNGAQVGTIATLTAGQNNNSNNGWTRFYGTLVTGPTTTSAVISITDLQNSPGGNDFGLDDISFATLSTFITLESAPGTDAQSICVNTPLTNIVYNVGNGSATGPIVAGLPAGVTSVFSGDQVTISGTPTVPGNYTYTLTTTGSCLPTTASGTINVQGQSLTLSSGSASPTVCINTAVNIGYTLGGTATGATTTGLPAGVTATLSGTAYAISGTPSIAGSYPYSITSTGTCAPVTVNGTITVQSQSIVLNSGNAIQTVCINNAIANIRYTIGGTGTGATVTGLPAGVTYSYNSGILFITGTPTVSGVFNYTVNTSGTCASVSASGTITVTANAALNLTSGAGSNIQTVCINTPITNITWAVNNAGGASATGLPAGVSGTYNAGVFTINGTPTAGGTFNYSITTNGGCGSATVTGTLTVQSQTITLTSGSSSPAVCANIAMTNIVYTFGGASTGASVTGLPAGISFSVAGNTITISGASSVAGSYPYTVTTTGTCSAVSAGGTITIQPGANGGSISSVSICSSSSGTLTLTGHSGSIVRWEYSTNNGVTWLPIANTTISQAYNNITVPTIYRAVINNGCGSVNSPAAVVGIHNYWTGGTNTDWHTASNWSDNQVPSLSCANVFIPGGRPNQPTLGSGSAAVQNIFIYPGAILTVDNATMKIAGTINNTGTFIAANGTIELNSPNAQTIPANTFQNNALNNLVINNSHPSGVTLGGSLDIYESLTYLGTGRSLNTGGFLTIKSTLSKTGRVGSMTGNAISGNVTVERFIPNHPKAWQFLSVPTTGQTVNQAWQEGNSPMGNSIPGHGTILTSNVAGAVGLGFDIFTPAGPSMKSYDPLTNGWVGVSSPGIQIANKKGYMLFVRGDRSVTVFNQPATSTILRTTGKLYTTGTDAPPPTSVLSGNFESVGNPYASAIDFTQITRSPNVDAKFYVWDPLLTNNYNGLGGYQTITAVSGWRPIPGGTANYDANVACKTIESGQAFLVYSTATGGNISFTEACKISNSDMVFRPSTAATAVGERQLFRASLYNGNITPAVIADGNLLAFDPEFSNGLDANDALKVTNTSENFGISKEDKTFALHARKPVLSEDTIFYTFSNLRRQPYQLRFDPENMSSGMTAFLVDKFLNTTTTISLDAQTVVDFIVTNDAASSVSDRFYIVFRTVAVVPVSMTKISATRDSEGSISVKWNVENEVNIERYEVERSGNGRNFGKVNTTSATLNNGGAANYSYVDNDPLYSDNYYRIKALGLSGQVQFSAIVKVAPVQAETFISVYPNPVVGKKLNIRFSGQPSGVFSLQLTNKPGQVVYRGTLSISGNNTLKSIALGKEITSGSYELSIIREDGTRFVIQVLVQ